MWDVQAVKGEMMIDRYAKVVLTVIALLLAWLCVQGQRQARVQNVNVVAIAGRAIGGGRPTRSAALPVTVANTVAVDGSVEIDGYVDVNGPVQVEGFVSCY